MKKLFLLLACLFGLAISADAQVLRFITKAGTPTACSPPFVTIDTTNNLFYMFGTDGGCHVAGGTGGDVTGAGANGQIAFWTGASGISGNANLCWDNTNKRVSIGKCSPAAALEIGGTGGVSSDILLPSFVSATAGGQILWLDSAGNPTAGITLTQGAATDNEFQLFSANAAGKQNLFNILAAGAFQISNYTGATQYLRIDSSGAVVIPQNQLEAQKTLKVDGSGVGYIHMGPYPAGDYSSIAMNGSPISATNYNFTSSPGGDLFINRPTNNVIHFNQNGGADDIAINGSGVFSTYGKIATAGNGQAAIRGIFDVSNGTTTINSTALLTAPAAGLYHVSAYTNTITAGTGVCTETLTIGWTDETGAKTQSATALDVGSTGAAAKVSGDFVVYVASGNVTYTATVAGVGCTNQVWTLHLRAESL